MKTGTKKIDCKAFVSWNITGDLNKSKENGEARQGRCVDEKGKYSRQEMGQKMDTEVSELESRAVIRYIK